jgi:hypothetical protein
LLLSASLRSELGDLLKRGVTLASRCDRASLQRLRALLDAVLQGAALTSASLSAAVFAVAAAAASIVRSSGVTLCRDELLERRHSSPAPASGELPADAAAVLPRTCSTACASKHADETVVTTGRAAVASSVALRCKLANEQWTRLADCKYVKCCRALTMLLRSAIRALSLSASNCSLRASSCADLSSAASLDLAASSRRAAHLCSCLSQGQKHGVQLAA